MLHRELLAASQAMTDKADLRSLWHRRHQNNPI